MRIAIISSLYPWRHRPYSGTFIRELVWEFARQGHDCVVISPVSIWDIFRFGRVDVGSITEHVPRSEATVEVVRPIIISTSARQIGSWNSIELSDLLFSFAVKVELDRIIDTVDCVYAHFFYPAGLAAVRYLKNKQIPIFIAHGDDFIDPWYLNKVKKDFQNVSGVVAVSTDNARFCNNVISIPDSHVTMLPNGVDRSLFYPRNRADARKRLGFHESTLLVAFVGHFIPRKGPDRVLSAIEGIPFVKALMIGEGPLLLSSKSIQFQGVVEHCELPWYLSAADIFVLPTTSEGSCNALLEAMACGLPVVTSDSSFNDDILNSSVGFRVDPMDIKQIRHVVSSLLFDSNLRAMMSKQCVNWSERFNIETRAQRIAEWMSERIRATTFFQLLR